jgi:lon-related putative ATP-dependent protease
MASKKNVKKAKSIKKKAYSVEPITKEAVSLPKGTPRDTSKISISKSLIDQVIGQEESVKIIRKAAAQKRNVLLIGIPGTGKSLLAAAMSEILPVQKLKDILIYPNDEDPNNPKVVSLKAGQGKILIDQARLETRKAEDSMRLISFLLPIGWMLIAGIFWQMGWYSDVIFAALLLIGAVLLIGLSIGGQMRSKETGSMPKLLINNHGRKVAPYFEGTGSRAGALLGDVRHDPLQSSIDEDSFVMKRNNSWEKMSYGKMWKEISKKHPDLVEKHEKGYEAIVLPKNEEIYVLGLKDNEVVPSRIYSLNRRPYDGEVVEIYADGEKATFTPEHSIITKKKDKKAEDISEKDTLFKLE